MEMENRTRKPQLLFTKFVKIKKKMENNGKFEKK